MPLLPQPRRLALPQIPEPCGNAWDAMHGDERQRLCDDCGKFVHNLENYPADQAEALLAGGEHVCVRARMDRRGQLVTLPHSSARLATRAVRWGRRARGVLTALAAIVMLPKLVGCVTGARIPGQSLPPPTTQAKRVDPDLMVTVSRPSSPKYMLSDTVPAAPKE